MDLLIKTLDGNEVGKLKVSESVLVLCRVRIFCNVLFVGSLRVVNRGHISPKGGLTCREQGRRCLSKRNWTCSALICSCATVSRWW